MDEGRPLRVLCLEDSAPDAELVSETLMRAGYQLDLDWVEDRAAFERLLAGAPYDIILADFALPGFNAHAALALARAAHPGTPFICVSGTIGEEATVELLKGGADDIVLKDKMARLPFAVQRALDERAHHQTLADSEARLRRTVEGTVEAMGAMIAARDPYTAGHEKRVTELAVAIAGVLGRDEAAAEGLRLAGLVHDIGKLTVPAEILNKPSRLTPIEFELIKGHAAAGYEILKSIEFEYPVADIVAQHHERLDGSGYPAGLEDDEIMLDSRILAVADVVEAMASHRPYRAAEGLEAALGEVRAGAGTHYDAAVVAACESVFERGFVFGEW